MSVFTIPTFDDPFYDQVTDLDGTDYLLEFRYNQRENCWYLSISLQDETPLVTGIKLVCNVNLTGRVADHRMPLGVLMAVANNPDDSTPGMGELGVDKRVTLCYLDAQEVQ